MEQCRAGLAGPRELDLGGHGGAAGGGRRRRRGAPVELWGSYRPRSSWAREVVSGGGRFGPGRLDGERAEEAAALRRPGVSWRLGETSGTRVRVRRCQEAAR